MNRDLNVILTVLANGYDVIIEINGIDIGIRGRKSESVKLFGKENPMVPVLPEDMKQHICLQEGDNSIRVRYKRVDEAASPELTVELQAREQFVNGATLFSLKKKADIGKENSFSDIIPL